MFAHYIMVFWTIVFCLMMIVGIAVPVFAMFGIAWLMDEWSMAWGLLFVVYFGLLPAWCSVCFSAMGKLDRKVG